MNRSLRMFLVVPVSVVVFHSCAFAHPMKGVGDFYAGMLHPLTTVDTVLPVIALSLLAGQQQRETAIKIIAAFPAALAAGTLLIALRPVPTALATFEVLITITAGLLIALARTFPSWVPVGLSIFIGLAIGWSNGAEITSGISAVRFVVGLSMVGLLATSYGIGLVRRLKMEWAQVAVRVVGSWLAAVGILVLGLR